jgi:hypothetical protein
MNIATQTNAIMGHSSPWAALIGGLFFCLLNATQSPHGLWHREKNGHAGSDNREADELTSNRTNSNRRN